MFLRMELLENGILEVKEYERAKLPDYLSLCLACCGSEWFETEFGIVVDERSVRVMSYFEFWLKLCAGFEKDEIYYMYCTASTYHRYKRFAKEWCIK